TIAAITVDTPAASYALAGTEYTLYMNPHVAMSYLDALIARVAQEYFQGARPWHTQAHTPGTDSYLGDPTIGVPDVWLYSGTGVITHHNSADTPDTVDPRSLDDLISIIASYLYFNASAGEQQLPWIAGIAEEYACRKMLEAASKGNDALASGNAKAAGYALD